MAWTDNRAEPETDTDAFSSSGTEYMDPVALPAGSATKMRMWIKTYFGAVTMKLALCNASRNVLASGQVDITAGNQYWEVTFGTPVTIAAGNYVLAWSFSNGNASMRFVNGVGGFYFQGDPYSSFPLDPLSLGSNAFPRDYAIGVNIEPDAKALPPFRSHFNHLLVR